ncbi:MAG: T9SS type A sorting domain-containing protein, partial [Bacteroidales bacterium]|nr:T9SS type A sorting domain-containing protein [Bacteroidales bacterium]
SNYYHGGELYAEGTEGSPVTFTPYDGITGSWNGIYFEDRSDWSGATNSLKNCIIEKGNDYNILCELTGSVTIDSCTIKDAVTDGIRFSSSNGSFTNSIFENNGRYPVYFMDWASNPWHKDNTFNSKGINYIVMSGGNCENNSTILSDNIEYFVLSSIIIGKYNNKCRLTIEPGVTMNFDTSTYIQVGHHSGYYHGGELYAEGNADSLITFSPYNSAVGGWEGIYFHDNSDWNSSTSSLKYCLIEKGDSYNVYCVSTSQPTFENCELTNAVGDGLKCYNASPGILSSTISFNGGHGIYLDGSSNPDIGNDPNYTNNLYENGPYEVYNNTSNNIDARYNYWGASDSAMIASRIYDHYDNTAKGIVIFGDFAQIPAMTTTTTLLSGNVWYNNASSSDMDNALMEVFDFGGSPIENTTTNGSGYYVFSSFTSGNYTLDITPDDVWGGVNSTDALLILNHFAHIDTLLDMELAAADVNYSQTVNGTDALFVMKRYTSMITSFPAGDWLYNTANLTINGNQVVNDFAMLCFGDVNSSYTPAKKDEKTVTLVYEGNQVIQSFTAFDLTISIKDMMEAGAISLGLIYPKEYMEITGAELLNTNGNVIFTSENGLFRIAYADMNAVNYAAGDEMLTINCMARDLTSMQEPILIELYEASEFANPMAQVIENVTLSAPELTTLTLGINNFGDEGLWLSENYPNPFRNTTTIRYQIPANGNVSLKVYNLTGTMVKELVNNQQLKGEHTVEFNCKGIEPGIYFYKLEFSNSENHTSLINKMSVTR